LATDRFTVEYFESAAVLRGVVLGWYDGPVSGFVWLGQPESLWYFELYATGSDSADIDDRLYTLSALPDDAGPTIESALAPLGLDLTSGMTVPEWRFPTTEAQTAADAAVDALVEHAQAPSVLLRSTSLNDIDAAWLIVGRSFPGRDHSRV
jgi:hypothetical protein